MLDDLNSLHIEFRKVAFSRLLHEFSRKVDYISERQSMNQISWDDAISQIGKLIQAFRQDARRLGISQDCSFEIDSSTNWTGLSEHSAN